MIRRPSQNPLAFVAIGAVITILPADVIFAGSGFYIRDRSSAADDGRESGRGE